MSSTAPKFLLGGVNFRRNFFGLQTMQTGAYGAIEVVIKTLPVLILGYAASKS